MNTRNIAEARLAEAAHALLLPSSPTVVRSPYPFEALQQLFIQRYVVAAIEQFQQRLTC